MFSSLVRFYCPLLTGILSFPFHHHLYSSLYIDLLIFHSRVLYSLPDGGDLKLDGNNPLLMIEVEAWVTTPEQVTSKMSNKFHFTFSLPDKDTCKKVVPENLAEGKRMAARIFADRDQAGLTMT